MPATQDDLQTALLTAEKNINNFEPPAPAAGSTDLQPTKDAAATKAATERAQALFPVIQQIATDMANQRIDERISAQLQQLQTDVNAIKAQLGL